MTEAKQEQSLSIKNDPYIHTMKTFLNRWKPFIIAAIRFDNATRFNRFTRQLPISHKVLTANLRELEDDGIIERIVYHEVPPRVEYRLTESGKTIIPILETLYDWGWKDMSRKCLDIDPLGEMWHGYREPDEKIMDSPFKKQK